jgi:hypothetical protein
MSDFDLKQRIRRLSEELVQLQHDLNWAALEEQAGRPDSDVSFDDIKNFKSIVDDMRHFLWSYIEGVTLRSGQNADVALQTFRMQRATEMLRSLREQMGEGSLSAPVPRSFVDEISNIADLTLQRHMGKKPPQD